MRANYGYEDGAGQYFIQIDTDLCDGCGDCVGACPAKLFAVGEDENDPLSEKPVARIVSSSRRTLKDACATCKPVTAPGPLPCVEACRPCAITHSW